VATSSQADVEPDPATDEGTVHDDGLLATDLECAQKVLVEGKLSLDHRLQVFTVQGTLEPWLVRLFPAPSFSCPAAKGCYHIVAAKLAIGYGNDHQRCKLNLMQLRRNKCKQADKMSGGNWPRLNDVDVVPADDAEPEVTATLTAAIAAPGIDNDDNTNDGNSATTYANMAVASSSSYGDSVCGTCSQSCLPAAKQKKAHVIRWTDCDQSYRWYHNVFFTAGPQYTSTLCSH